MADLPTISERDFQQQVVELAQYCGWSQVYHTYDSRNSAAGFPDLILIRDGVLVAAELKTQTGRVTPDQMQWYGALLQVEERAQGAVRAFLWRPSDMDEIEKVLQRSHHPSTQ